MTRSPLWREFESGDSILLVVLRQIIIWGGIIILIFTGQLELTWPQQAVLGLLMFWWRCGWTAPPPPTSLR